MGFIPPFIPHLIILKHSDNKSQKTDLIEETKKELKLKVERIISIYDPLEFEISIQYFNFHHQIKLIKKVEKIKLNEIKKIEEKIDNDEYVNYETIESVLKKLDIIQNLKNDMILNYKKVEQFGKEIHEEIKNVKGLTYNSFDSIFELNKISDYLDRFLKKLEDYDLNNKYFKEFISVFDISDENTESLELKVSIGKFNCDEKTFQQALVLLKKFIDLTEIKEINHLCFNCCAFFTYSDETKQMFESVFSSLNIIEKIKLDLSDEDCLLFSKCKFNKSSEEDSDIWQKKLIR